MIDDFSNMQGDATVQTRGPFPDLTDSLAILNAAMRKTPVSAANRVCATADSQSVDEGLAVLRCYVTISDRQVRQAILDVLARVAAGASE